MQRRVRLPQAGGSVDPGIASLRSYCLHHAAGMDKKALQRAAPITLRRAICQRFQPEAESDAWLERIQAEHTSGTAWTRPHLPFTMRAFTRQGTHAQLA